MGKGSKKGQTKGALSKQLNSKQSAVKGNAEDIAIRNAQALEISKSLFSWGVAQDEDISESETESNSISESLGDEDTMEEAAEAPPSSDSEGNRQAINGTKLKQMTTEDGPVKILETDLDEEHCAWSHCLVGYFAGRFPGKEALQQITSSWKAKADIHFHNSGWIIFKFADEEAQLRVLQEGPYLVYGRPLLLKIMPKFFKFDDEDLCKFPVWVQFRNLPLKLWTKLALSRLCSKLGKPVFADQLTSNKARVSYARALVEVDVSKEIVKHIDLLLPNGDVMVQEVHYENLPQFCSHCKRVGHSVAVCKALGNNGNKGKVNSKAARDNRKIKEAAWIPMPQPQVLADKGSDKRNLLNEGLRINKAIGAERATKTQGTNVVIGADDQPPAELAKEKMKEIDKPRDETDNAETEKAWRTREIRSKNKAKQVTEVPASGRLVQLPEVNTVADENAETSNIWQSVRYKNKHKSKKKEKVQRSASTSTNLDIFSTRRPGRQMKNRHRSFLKPEMKECLLTCLNIIRKKQYAFSGFI